MRRFKDVLLAVLALILVLIGLALVVLLLPFAAVFGTVRWRSKQERESALRKRRDWRRRSA